MARGDGGERNSAVPMQARLAGVIAGRIEGLTNRLMRSATSMRQHSRRVAESAAQKQAHRQAWKTLAKEGVPLRRRLLLRLRATLDEHRTKHEKHRARFEELRRERMGHLETVKGMDAYQTAWLAARAFRPAEELEVDNASLLARVQKLQSKVNQRSTARAQQGGSEWMQAKLPVEAAPTELDGVPVQAEPAKAKPLAYDPKFGLEIQRPPAKPNPKMWDDFGHWLGQFTEWKDYERFTRKENQHKMRELRTLFAGLDEGWEQFRKTDMVNLLTYSGITQEHAAAVVQLERTDPERLKEAVWKLVEKDTEGKALPLEARIDNFCRVLGKVQSGYYRPPNKKEDDGQIFAREGKYLTEGNKLGVASVFLHAIYAEDAPVYRHMMGRTACKVAGITPPTKGASQGQKYVHYLGVLDEVSNQMEKREHPLPDRLGAFEALLWVIDGPRWYERMKKGKSSFPDWDDTKLGEYLSFHERMRKK